MNALSLSPPRLAIALLLGLFMVATRFHHFGSAVSLPDASLAVFFLVGIYLRPSLFLAAFLAEAALIDYLAITYGSVSDWCVTPAYFFLIPTYASVWFAGRWYASRHQHAWRTLVPLLATLAAGTTAAFLISNSSFFLLSGRFPDMSWMEYGTRAAKYFPPYISSTFLYVLFVATVHTVLTASIAHRLGRSVAGAGKD